MWFGGCRSLFERIRSTESVFLPGGESEARVRAGVVPVVGPAPGVAVGASLVHAERLELDVEVEAGAQPGGPAASEPVVRVAVALVGARDGLVLPVGLKSANPGGADKVE